MSYLTRLQSILQTKLAPRTTGTSVGVGGVAASLSSGSFSINAQTGVAVTNWDISITTSGRPIMVMINATGNISSGISLGESSGNDVVGNVQILNNSTLVWTIELTLSIGSSYNYYSNPFSFLDIQSAGTYNYTATASSAAGTLNINNLSLVAYEI